MEVKNQQSLLDIAIEHCGNAESAFELAMLNGFSLSDELERGSELKSPGVVDADVCTMFVAYRHSPATAITAEQYNETIEGEGVEFWGIEFDFIVS